MSCPSWARSTARTIQQMPDGAVDAIVLVCHILGYALTSSFFLAGFGLPLIAIATVITALDSDCDLGASLQSEARIAAAGLDVAIALCSLAAFFAAFSLAGIGAAAVLVPIVTLLSALRVVLAPLGAGQSPTLGALSALASAGAGMSGNTDAQSASRWLKDAVSAADADHSKLPASARAQIEGEKMEPDDADPFAPMLQWRALQPPPGSGGKNSLANSYSHTYQSSAEATYASDPTADLRPWLVAQLPVDINYAAHHRAALMAVPQLAFRFGPGIDEALRRLRNWLTAATTSQPGAWDRATVRRVLQTGDLQTDLPVVGDDDGSRDETSSGSGAGVLALLGTAAALFAATR